MFRKRRGQSLIEFTMVGIPLIFILITTEEVARGMWIYHTLNQAIKAGTRYVIVKGSSCIDGGNTCGVTLGTVTTQITNWGVGLLPADLNVTLTAGSATTTCNAISTCTGSSAAWPPAGSNSPGTTIQITGTYQFNSAIAVFWPGQTGGMQLSRVTFSATSSQPIQF